MTGQLEIRFPEDQQEGTEAVMLKWLKANRGGDPERLASFRGWKRLGDDGEAESEDHGGTERLEDASTDEKPDRGGECRQQRSHREHAEAGREDRLLADHVAKPPDAEDQGGLGEQVGKRNPLGDGEGGLELIDKGRQCDVEHRAVDGAEKYGHGDCHQHVPLVCVVDPFWWDRGARFRFFDGHERARVGRSWRDLSP